MATFDEYVKKVAAYVEDLRSRGKSVRQITCPPLLAASTEGLPIRVGEGANPGIILRSDTFAELGNPEAGSCALVLWTDDPALVRDGTITVIGPDIPESAGASLPFGQVLLVGGRELTVEEHQTLSQAQYVADQIEGYMIKSSSRNLWGRVSKDVAAKGFCFEMLGRALTAIYKSTSPKVEAMEVVFITSDKEDVLRLGEIAGEVQEVSTEIVKEHWKARGYDLDCDLDCKSCSEKAVCDDIRDVISAKARKQRESTGGNSDSGIQDSES